MKNNRISLYKKTTDKLFNAYYNDELKHADCRACAVGNILDGDAWKTLFCTVSSRDGIESKQLLPKEGEYIVKTSYMGGMITRLEIVEGKGLNKRVMEENEKIKQEGLKLIEQSGYTRDELAKIENVFEIAEKGSSEEDYMFNGLVAVLDTLKEIHEISDDVEEINRFSTEHKRKLELV